MRHFLLQKLLSRKIIMNKKLKSLLACCCLFGTFILPAQASLLSHFNFSVYKGFGKPVEIYMKLRTGEGIFMSDNIFYEGDTVKVQFSSPLYAVEIEASAGGDVVCDHTISDLIRGPEDTIYLDVNWMPGQPGVLKCDWYLNDDPV